MKQRRLRRKNGKRRAVDRWDLLSFTQSFSLTVAVAGVLIYRICVFGLEKTGVNLLLFVLLISSVLYFFSSLTQSGWERFRANCAIAGLASLVVFFGSIIWQIRQGGITTWGVAVTVLSLVAFKRLDEVHAMVPR